MQNRIRPVQHSTTTTRVRAEDWYTAAARAAHNQHCTYCREITEASDAATAANGESIRRRDRRQLGLNIAPRGRAVSA